MFRPPRRKLLGTFKYAKHNFTQDYIKRRTVNGISDITAYYIGYKFMSLIQFTDI